MINDDKEYIETLENPEDEKEIDILEIVYKLWSRRKLILVWCLGGIITGLVIAFSIPREYTTNVDLAPEFNIGRYGGLGYSTYMSMYGFGMGANSSDAVYPQLYPDVLNSVPFMTGLFNVEVTTAEDGQEYTLEQYMSKKIEKPWWKTILGIPGKITGMFKTKKVEPTNHQLDNFRLTEKESDLVGALRNRITADIDQKTFMVSISVKMQDPLVSAIIADTVVNRLQNYITEYRTNKARQDLAYAEKINEEAQTTYYDAQQRYADYVDRNQGLSSRTAQITRDRLENEASLAFNLYNRTMQQVNLSKANVQETTPVYAVITPPTVPVRPSAPRKMLITAAFLFLGLIGSCAWILFGAPMIEQYKKKKEVIEAERWNPEKERKKLEKEL